MIQFLIITAIIVWFVCGWFTGRHVYKDMGGVIVPIGLIILGPIFWLGILIHLLVNLDNKATYFMNKLFGIRDKDLGDKE